MDDQLEKALKQLITSDGRVRVKLVPMPSGDNPWRTQGDYKTEQKREKIRFWVTIVSLIISILSVVATALIAITTIKSVA